MKDKKRYSIMEVEQFVGVSRTKIRHYVDKGLLKISKDEHSGYYYYTFDDLMVLCQIIYYREHLGFSIEKVEQLLEANDIELVESITKKQLDFLNEEMKVRDQQRNTMLFTRRMLDRQYSYRDKLTLVPFGTAYLVPYAYYYIPGHSVYPIMYGCSEFSFDGSTVSHVKKCCLVFEKDAEYVDPDDFDLFRTEAERIEMGMCVHAVTLTDKDVHDPSLLEPAIEWATRHHFRVNGRIFLAHFFPYRSGNTTFTYVEAYLPIDIPQ